MILSLAGLAPDLEQLLERAREFKDAPHPYSQHLALVIVLLLLWLLLRRQDNRKQGDLKRSAGDVLEERFKSGELSKEAYLKARADLTLRPKGR